MLERLVKVIIIYLVFVLTAVVIHACGGEAVDITITGVSSKAVRLGEIEIYDHNPDLGYYNVVECNNIEDTAVIRYDSLGIEVNTTTEREVVWESGINSSFIIQTCSADEQVTFEKIVDVIVTSDKDYSQNYLKGSDLKDIINVSYGTNINRFNIIDFFISYYSQNKVLFRFIYPPDREEVHTITIKYITDRGNEFETTQGNLLITN